MVASHLGEEEGESPLLPINDAFSTVFSVFASLIIYENIINALVSNAIILLALLCFWVTKDEQLFCVA